MPFCFESYVSARSQPDAQDEVFLSLSASASLQPPIGLVTVKSFPHTLQGDRAGSELPASRASLGDLYTSQWIQDPL